MIIKKVVGTGFNEHAALQSAWQDPAWFNENSNVYNGSNYRHHGRRNRYAILRRALSKKCRALPDIVPGEAGTRMSMNSSFDLPELDLSKNSFKEEGQAICSASSSHERRNIRSRDKKKHIKIMMKNTGNDTTNGQNKR